MIDNTLLSTELRANSRSEVHVMSGNYAFSKIKKMAAGCVLIQRGWFACLPPSTNFKIYILPTYINFNTDLTPPYIIKTIDLRSAPPL